MKAYFYILFPLLLLSCSQSGTVQKSVNGKEQMELVKGGLLFVDENNLSSEQKELRSKIYQIVLDYISVDTIANHLLFTMTKREFEQTGLDMSIYDELEVEITDINNYADSTGMGKEIFSSWNQSKEEYLRENVK